LSDAQVASM